VARIEMSTAATYAGSALYRQVSGAHLTRSNWLRLAQAWTEESCWGGCLRMNNIRPTFLGADLSFPIRLAIAITVLRIRIWQRGRRNVGVGAFPRARKR